MALAHSLAVLQPTKSGPMGLTYFRRWIWAEGSRKCLPVGAAAVTGQLGSL